MKKRNLVVMVVIIFIATNLLVGCKSQTPVVKPSRPKISVRPYSKPVDLKGRVIKIFSYVNQKGKLVDLLKKDKSLVAQKELEKVIRIQNKYNCTFEYVNEERDFNNFFKVTAPAIIGGRKKVDFIEMFDFTYICLVSNDLNVFQPLDNYTVLDIKNPKLWNTKKMEQLSHGIVNNVVCNNSVYQNFLMNDVVFFNKSKMIKEGLWDKYNLYEMVKNKTWTWNSFKTLCQKVTKDTDKDGKTDNYGVAFDPWSMVNDFVLSNNSSLITVNNNKAVFSINEPNQKQSYDFLKSLKDSGCMRIPEIKNNTADREDISNKFVGGNDLFLFVQGQAAFQLKGQMKDDWGVVPLPLGPENKSKEYVIGDTGSICMGIAKKAENPEVLAQILSELAPVASSDEEMLEFYSERIKAANPDITPIYKQLSTNEAVRDNITYLYTNGVGALYGFCFNSLKNFQGTYSDEDLINKQIPETQRVLSELWRKFEDSMYQSKRSAGIK